MWLCDIFKVIFAVLFSPPPQLKDETKETAVWHLPTPEEGSQPQLAFIRKTVVFTVLCTEELTPLIPLHG